MKRIIFSELRGDWYRGADLMARLIARASSGEEIRFEGFPRQWLPLFQHWRVQWSGSIAPPQPVPIVSDLAEDAILNLTVAAQTRGQLRPLVEAWSSLDPLTADVLYRLDRRVNASPPADQGNGLPLTGWQSYGRPDVRAFDRLVERQVPRNDLAILLPCARTRPYARSRTHKRIWRALGEKGLVLGAVDAIVVSSIGVVPEALWNHPVVQTYDSGVPDIWRVYRLMRAYLAKASYRFVYDCLEFAPYSEIIAILAREGLIGEVQRIKVGKVLRLPL